MYLNSIFTQGVCSYRLSFRNLFRSSPSSKSSPSSGRHRNLHLYRHTQVFSIHVACKIHWVLYVECYRYFKNLKTSLILSFLHLWKREWPTSNVKKCTSTVSIWHWTVLPLPLTPFCIHIKLYADGGVGAVSGVDLRPLGRWDRGFTSRRGHGCSSLVLVACCIGSA